MKLLLFIFLLCTPLMAQEFVPLEDTVETVDHLDTTEKTTALATSKKINWESSFFNYDSKSSIFSLYGESRSTVDKDSLATKTNKSIKQALLEYKGIKLYSDSIFLFQKDQWINAKGKPHIDDANNNIYGEAIIYNHQKKVGEISYGSLKEGKNFFNGIHIRRQKNTDIFISYGDVTTCNRFANPHYFFYSRRMVVENKKQTIVKPIVLNIANVPLVMLPFMVIPLGTERRSGFTQPKIGGDEEQGFFIKNVGYFIAINNYTDLQSTVDILEGRTGTFDRINFQNLFRYKRGEHLNGSLTFKAYTFGLSSNIGNWEFNFSHLQNLTPDKRHTLKGSGRIASSSILNEATDNLEAINQDANFEIGYSGPIPLFDVGKVFLRIKQDQSLETGRLVREFPTISIDHSGQVFPEGEKSKWWDKSKKEEEISIPLYRRLQYSYRGGTQLYSSRDSLDDPNNNFFGASRNIVGLSLNYPLFSYINLKPSINISHYWVAHSRPSPIIKNRLDTIMVNNQDTIITIIDSINIKQGMWGQNVLLYNTKLSIGTQLYGISNPKIGSFQKIRHTVIPNITFTYQPKIDTNFNFLSPFGSGAFSSPNGQNERRSVGFSLANSVDIKLLEMEPVVINDSNKVNSKISLTNTIKPTKEVSKKIFNTNSSLSYDFKDKDGRKWTDINSGFSTELIKFIPVTINFVHTLYDDFSLQGKSNRVGFPILKRWDFSWRYNFTFDGQFHTGDFLTEKKSSRWKDWNARANYTVRIQSIKVGSDLFNTTITHSLSGNASLWVTEAWSTTYNTSYDFLQGRFSSHNFTFKRSLHRWRIDFTWTPVGASTGWTFKIFLIDIPDVKIERSSININR